MNALSRIRAGALLCVAMLSGSVLAQVPDRVGRIAYLSGDVQFYSESAQAWQPAQLNAPVSSRNSLFTGPRGRAEIRFGSTAVALDSQTQLDIQLLDDSQFKAGVTRGSINLRVPQIDGNESYEVLAPAATYAILKPGRYRVDAADNGSSVTVLAGMANAAVAGDGEAMVETGQALSAADGGFVRSAARSSALDNWAARRDKALRSSQAARYVSPNMTGYEELDANGRWASDPDYGTVWYPTTYVSPGWVPYRDGHWAFVAPWGWTWIDDAPWGFAPFHYGRWVSIGPRWAWMPGTYVRRPSYAPALVGFIGGSTAVAISIGTQPAVGWYPLPPWERYRPAYEHHDRQVTNINNFTIVNPPANAWRSVEQRRVSANQVQGATVVPREAFVDSRPVRRSLMSVTAPVLAAPHTATVPLLAPPRAALPGQSGGGRPEFGEQRVPRAPDQGRATPEMNRGSAALPPRSTTVLPQPAPASAAPRQGLFSTERRDEKRTGEQPVQPLLSPQTRQSAPLSRGTSTQPAPVGSSESRTSVFRTENRGVENRGTERQSPPSAIALPQVNRAAPVPQPRPMPSPELAAPRVRVESPVVQRSEPRVESRPVQRVEPRPEPRPMPRVEPPQVRTPAVQAPPTPQPQVHAPAPPAEQKRAPDQERERRAHGEPK